MNDHLNPAHLSGLCSALLCNLLPKDFELTRGSHIRSFLLKDADLTMSNAGLFDLYFIHPVVQLANEMRNGSDPEDAGHARAVDPVHASTTWCGIKLTVSAQYDVMSAGVRAFIEVFPE